MQSNVMQKDTRKGNRSLTTTYSSLQMLNTIFLLYMTVSVQYKKIKTDSYICAANSAATYCNRKSK